jgi:hypothetical protein
VRFNSFSEFLNFSIVWVSRISCFASVRDVIVAMACSFGFVFLWVMNVANCVCVACGKTICALTVAGVFMRCDFLAMGMCRSLFSLIEVGLYCLSITSLNKKIVL